jgi:hypothetical protein
VQEKIYSSDSLVNDFLFKQSINYIPVFFLFHVEWNTKREVNYFHRGSGRVPEEPMEQNNIHDNFVISEIASRELCISELFNKVLLHYVFIVPCQLANELFSRTEGVHHNKQTINHQWLLQQVHDLNKRLYT